MRDAVELEASGKPTAIVVNDVFAPIAHATAKLLALPAGYVENNVVWLPHPTSNLTSSAVTALVDERISLVRDALLGRLAAPEDSSASAVVDANDVLSLAQKTVAGLAESLQADGAELVLLDYTGGVLAGELRVGELTCDDGSCVMPASALAKMIEAMLHSEVPGLREVLLRETGLRPAT